MVLAFLDAFSLAGVLGRLPLLVSVPLRPFQPHSAGIYLASLIWVLFTVFCFFSLQSIFSLVSSDFPCFLALTYFPYSWNAPLGHLGESVFLSRVVPWGHLQSSHFLLPSLVSHCLGTRVPKAKDPRSPELDLQNLTTDIFNL